MKAVLLTAHGGPEMLRYGDAPDPVAGPGEIVVDVHAASVNAADYKVRLGGGAYNAASKLQFPYILGRDFSGIVSALGSGVDDLKIGDAVFGVMDAGIEGCYAEKVKIKSALVAKKPAKLGHAEAAAMALTSLTAIWALEDTARPARPRSPRAHERALREGRGLAARDHAFPACRGGRGTPHQRRPPPARQARADRPLGVARLRAKTRRDSPRVWSRLLLDRVE